MSDMDMVRTILQMQRDIARLQLVETPVAPYGSMYGDDIAQVVTVASANVGYALAAGLTAGPCSAEFTFSNASRLNCLRPGTYMCNWSMSITTATNGDTIAGQIMINATEVHTLEGNAYYQNAGRYQCVGGHGIITLALNDYVRFAVENETSGSNITVTHANMTLTRVGN